MKRVSTSLPHLRHVNQLVHVIGPAIFAYSGIFVILLTRMVVL